MTSPDDPMRVRVLVDGMEIEWWWGMVSAPEEVVAAVGPMYTAQFQWRGALQCCALRLQDALGMAYSAVVDRAAAIAKESAMAAAIMRAAAEDSPPEPETRVVRAHRLHFSGVENVGLPARLGLLGPAGSEIEAPWYSRLPWSGEASWRVSGGGGQWVSHVAVYDAGGSEVERHELDEWVRLVDGQTFVLRWDPAVRDIA